MATKKRSDRISDGPGGMLAVWAFEAEPGTAMWSEYLVTVQGLKGEDMIRHRDDVTHELHVFILSPEVPTDFKKNLFEQSALRPLTPSAIAYQFVSDNDDTACALVDALVDEMLAGSLSPDDPSQPAWAIAMPASVPLRTSAQL